MHRLVAWACFVALSGAGYSKKEPPPPTRACVLRTENGASTAQCFEHTENRSRALQEQQCNEFEVVTGGTKKLVDGPCPMAGSGGVCLSSAGSKSICYSSPERGKTICRGTYTRE